MKIGKLLPLLILPFVSVTACSSIFGDRNNVDYMYKKSQKFKSYKLLFKEADMKKEMAAIEEALKKEDYEAMIEHYSELNYIFYLERQDYVYLTALFNGDLNENARAKKERLDEIDVEIEAWIKDFYTAVRDSKFKDKFYEGYTDEQINVIIDSYNPEASNLYGDYYKLSDDYELSFNDPLKNTDIELYEEKMIGKYVEIAEKLEEIAKANGQEDPLQYVYDGYSHGYAVSDMSDYIRNSKRDFFNAISSVTVDVKGLEPRDVEVINDFNSYYFDKPNVQGMKIMEGVGKLMAPRYSKTFNSLFKTGYYFFSDNPNSLSTAYIDDYGFEPIAYFSRNYQDLLTVVHEFGHYYAFCSTPDAAPLPYDIYETHSQGNEFLVLAYLQKNWDFGWRKKGFDKFVQISNYNRFIDLAKMLQAVECETYIFQNYKTKTVKEIHEDINEISEEYVKYGVSPLYYLYTGSSPGYYSAYLTSLIAAMDLYTVAISDFDRATSIYESIIDIKECKNVRQSYIDAGLIDYKDSTQVRNLLNRFTTYING